MFECTVQGFSVVTLIERQEGLHTVAIIKVSGGFGNKARFLFNDGISFVLEFRTFFKL